MIAEAPVHGATAQLISATPMYHLLILVVSRCWSGGYLADGSSAALYGPRSGDHERGTPMRAEDL